jgi:hypothetical protein
MGKCKPDKDPDIRPNDPCDPGSAPPPVGAA